MAYICLKMHILGPNMLIIVREGAKALVPSYQKPYRRVARIIFGRAWQRMGQKGQYLAQNDQTCQFWPFFGPKS